MSNKKQLKQQELVVSSGIDEIFKLVKDDKEKIHIVVGNYKVSEKTFDTYRQADEYICTKPWELLFNLTYLIVKHEIEQITKKAEEPAKESK